MQAEKTIRKRDRSRQRLNTRAAILGGAETVFGHRGYEASSMEAIADAAGVSKITLYRHFENKEALFSSVIQHMCARVYDDDVEQAMDRMETVEALQYFGRRLLAVVFSDETLKLHRMVMAEAQLFPELGSFFYNTGVRPGIDALARFLSRPDHRKRLRLADPQKSAEHFMGVIRGYQHMRLLLGLDKTPNKRRMEATIKDAIHLVLKDAA